MLVFDTTHADPITCLRCFHTALEEVLVFIGTAAGSVRLFFQQAKTWNHLLLCKRSEEAIVGLALQTGEGGALKLFAVVGDVCIKTWDLNNLQSNDDAAAAAFARGCRVSQRTEFALVHSFGFCSTASVLLDENIVVLVRSNGESCSLKLDAARGVLPNTIAEDVGPLPVMHAKSILVGFDAATERLVFASTLAGNTTLSMYNLHGHLLAKLRREVPRTRYGLGRCTFRSNSGRDELLFIWEGRLALLALKAKQHNEEETGVCLVQNAPKRLVAFEQRSDDATVCCITDSGQISLGTISQDDAKFTPITGGGSSRISTVSFHFNLPYFISSARVEPASTRNSANIVAFNDDFGLHIMELT